MRGRVERAVVTTGRVRMTDRRPRESAVHELTAVERALGGLVGVVCGEVWRTAWDDGGGDPSAEVAAGPATDALLALTACYATAGRRAFRKEVAGHRRGPLPAWLLATAVARQRVSSRMGDALELASTAGARGTSLGACVRFVELAAALAAGHATPVAIRRAAGEATGPLVPGELPCLRGDTAIDSLQVGVWVLTHPACGVADVVPAVMTRLGGPPVAAAVGGLLGLRDGLSAIPSRWRRHVAACVTRCEALVRQLGNLAPAA